MPTVFLLTVTDTSDFDGVVFEGVFSTQALAEKQCAAVKRNWNHTSDPEFRNSLFATITPFVVQTCIVE